MAIQIIKQDMLGILVEYKPPNRLPPYNIRINCVILYINPDGNVDRTPKVGDISMRHFGMKKLKFA
jgi:hypothetical protein